ncbi:hydroxyisourate hydrolase [Bradyrhizobium sp. SYSU BS000235]|uniref:hydroxyisourate hydrolase n=1 Tax=Bradyrhizobium sp. SYSU BS000235 TaxID=3411332 RepID=UPI003C7752F4
MKRLVLALAIVGASLSVSADASPSHAQAKKKASGDLSTIVTNAVSGGSAAGMIIELYEISGAKPRKITQVSTGEDGRADLISSGPLPLGKYELRFQVGDYFRKQSVGASDPALLDFVPVRFSITDPAGHYHVPLTCTPSSYTTYRGS